MAKLPDPPIPRAVARGAWSPTPSPGAVEAGTTVVPMYALHTPGHVVIATMVGTHLAAALLIAANYRRLGRPRAALVALTVGAALTAGLIALDAAAGIPMIYCLPLSVFPGLFAMMELQGNTIDAHVWGGGRTDSWWRVLAVSVASLLTIVGAYGALAAASG